MQERDERLGKKGRCKITGFEGTITGITQYLTGCDNAMLQPTVDKEGKHRDCRWFDADAVEILDQVIAPAEVQGEVPGGPRNDHPPDRGQQ